MGIYNRNADYPDRPANWWLDYYASGKRVREPGCGRNQIASQRLLDKRLKEIAAGTWRHPRMRRAEDMSVAQAFERFFAVRVADAEASPARRAQQNVKDQEKRVETYVLPVIGDRPLRSIVREDVRALIVGLVGAGHLAPRSIHHVYDAIRGMFKWAITSEPPLVERTPCTLTVKFGELPKKKDKDPGWRKRAVFSHGELQDLLTNEIVPIDRRVFYGLLSLGGGMRFGEAAGRKVSDYDPHARPLGRLHITTQYNDEALKGDGPEREVPVHPFLAWLLDEWLSSGFESILGRPPRPDDWLVPSRTFNHRSLKHMENKLEQDLERLKLRRRTPHNLRATFITLAQNDGGIKEILHCVTHEGVKDVWSGYSRYSWPQLCEQVAKLQLAPPSPKTDRSHFRSHAGIGDLQVPEIARVYERDGRDLNPRPPA